MRVSPSTLAFIASLGLHLALFLVYLLPRNQTVNETEPVTVSVHFQTEEKPLKTRKKLRAGGGKGVGKNVNLSLGLHSARALESGSYKESLPNEMSSSWGENGSDFSRTADLGFMERVFEATDQSLYYPGILARHSIAGVVNSRLVFDDLGKCDWKKTQISALDPHLRIFILSVLKDTCKQDFSRFAKSARSRTVDMSFQFEITEHNDRTLISKQSKIIGNVLLFYRNTQKSVGEWHLGPFQGMFPIPFVSVDFGWIVENWEKIVGHHDPLKEFSTH